MSVHVVIVHHQTPHLMERCLMSVRDQDAGIERVVVVDTSAVGSPVREPPPHIGDAEWVPTANIGYGSAANLGAIDASADAILVMNADVTLRPGALRALLARLEREPRCAIVGPRIESATGHLEHSARAFPSLSTGLLGRTSGLTAALLRFGHTPRQLADSTLVDGRVVDWVAGSCILVRRSDWLALRGFDLGFWMYWEDADLCRRARMLGRETWFEPLGTCEHVAGASGRSRRTVESFHASAALYYERHIARSRLEGLVARYLLRMRARLRVRGLAS